MTHLDLGRIRAFVAAADARNLSRAAALLHLTQPALSKQISSLEDDLGVRLFDRVSSGVQLTSAGHDLLDRARLLLLQAEDLRERARLLQGGATGVLNIGATSMSIESFVAPFIVSFREHRPQVEVRVTESGGVQLLRQVERGDLHLAITGPRAPHLVFHLLFPVRLVAVMTADHEFAGCRTIELRKIVDEPLLAMRPEFTGRQVFDAACQMSCLRPRVVFETGVPLTLLAMARIRCGVAIVPSNQLIEDPTLAQVPIVHDGRSLGQWLAVNWHPQRQLPLYAETFITELRASTEQTFPGGQFSYAPPVPVPGE